MLTHIRQSKTSVILSAVLALCIGCADVSPDPPASPQEANATGAPFSLRVRTPEGVQEGTQSQAELDELLASCPTVQADGRLVSDCGVLLAAKQVDLALANGTLKLTGDGQSLRHAGAAGDNDLVEVSWDAEFRELTLHYDGDGTNQIELKGIEDVSVRKQVIGALSAQAFSSQRGLSGLDEQNTNPLCLAIVIIAVAWVACVIYDGCEKSAIKACKNKGGLYNFSKVCGAGYDASGGFRLGYSCTWQCNTCPI